MPVSWTKYEHSTHRCQMAPIDRNCAVYLGTREKLIKRLRWPWRRPKFLTLSDQAFMIVQWGGLWDHAKSRCILYSTSGPPSPRLARELHYFESSRVMIRPDSSWGVSFVSWLEKQNINATLASSKNLKSTLRQECLQVHILEHKREEKYCTQTRVSRGLASNYTL